MKKLLAVLLFPFMMNGQEIAKSEIVNPDGKWFFGVEIGQNTITSYTLNEPYKSFQGGILTEYYFGRHWSLTGRIKYFNIGHSYFFQGYIVKAGFGFFSSSSYPDKLFQFDGKVFSIPINLNWEYRISKNFHGTLSGGFSYNFETKTNYVLLNIEDYQKYSLNQYFGYNTNFGFNYFISRNNAIFINLEYYLGNKRKLGFFYPERNSNTLLNFGYKYSFKN